jgi:hypothetical protein
LSAWVNAALIEEAASERRGAALRAAIAGRKTTIGAS